MSELENLMHETRTFAPTPEFAAAAVAQASLFAEASADRLAFWAKQARTLSWETDFTQVLDWSDAPFARWFVGGKLNVAYNCVDRHVENGYGDQVAIRFEGEPGDRRDLTYRDLQREVSKAAHGLTELGIGAGDRVAIYLPMIPEAVIAMLACARIGAPHSVVFAGFSAEALRSRIEPLCLHIERALQGARQLVLCQIERPQPHTLRLCHQLGCGGGCGRAQIGHKVGQGEVGLVPYPTHHGHGA